MLHFLPGFVKGIICFIFIILNVVILSTLIYLLAILRLLIPTKSARKFFTFCITEISSTWVCLNSLCIDITQKIEWDIKGLENLKENQWYLIISNHQSWTDILILQKIFNRKIPFLKFFVKDELKWVPVMGIVWWALEYPFMKRYSKEYLAKHPEMKGKDLKTTRKACERFKEMPISVINFIEGTRFSPEKHSRQASPYQYLLKPKTGGVALVLSAMGEQFTAILNVTLSYETQEHNLWQFGCGKVKKVSIIVDQLSVPTSLIGGDYENNPAFREHIQQWLHQLWLKKDLQLKALHEKENSSTSCN